MPVQVVRDLIWSPLNPVLSACYFRDVVKNVKKAEPAPSATPSSAPAATATATTTAAAAATTATTTTAHATPSTDYYRLLHSRPLEGKKKNRVLNISPGKLPQTTQRNVVHRRFGHAQRSLSICICTILSNDWSDVRYSGLQRLKESIHARPGSTEIATRSWGSDLNE